MERECLVLVRTHLDELLLVEVDSENEDLEDRLALTWHEKWGCAHHFDNRRLAHGLLLSVYGSQSGRAQIMVRDSVLDLDSVHRLKLDQT
jgi:hypothetical protein